MNEKKIPIVIITSFSKTEYIKFWKPGNKPDKKSDDKATYGFWILDHNGPRIEPFRELDNIYGKVKSLDDFKNVSFTVPTGTIIALVLDGKTGDKNPHQFEILLKLRTENKYNLKNILVHPADGTAFGDFIGKKRFLDEDNISKYINYYPQKKNIESFGEKPETSIPCYEYSYGKIDNAFYDWIKIISEAIKNDNLSCATNRLKELTELLEGCKKGNFKKILAASTPAPCYFYKIISELLTPFANLAIDLQGIAEMVEEAESIPRTGTAKKNKTDECKRYGEIMERAVEYLRDISDGKDAYSRQKLADARFLVFGKTYGNGPLPSENDFIPVSVPLNYSEAVSEKYNEKTLKEIHTDTLKSFKPKLKKLAEQLGLKETDGTNDFKEDPDDALLNVLCRLDYISAKEVAAISDKDLRTVKNDFNIFSNRYKELVKEIKNLKAQIK